MVSHHEEIFLLIPRSLLRGGFIALLVILFLSDTHGGHVHDLRIAEATPYPLPAGSGLLQDLGFLAFTLP